MIARGLRFAACAEQLAGSPFRLHGREPDGLDCVGLVALALARAGLKAPVPAGYRLRNTDVSAFMPFAAQAGFAAACGPLQRGDLLLVRPGAAQQHLCIAIDPSRIVHAHAGLGRVAVHTLPAAWHIQYHWRLCADPKE